MHLRIFISIVILLNYSCIQDNKFDKGINLLNQKEVNQQYSIEELCEVFKSDKCKEGHNFIEQYESIFSAKRDSIKKVLEIGIFRGDSHRLWKGYFTNAKIYGIDINGDEGLSQEGIFTYRGDQSNRKDLENFVRKYGSDFDIIIDDGGHAMEQQQISWGFLFPYVKSGGLYIIEDVHTSLPKYYGHHSYHVNEDETNTTLVVLEKFIRTEKIKSDYLLLPEMEYLEKNIESIQLVMKTNDKHSMMCIVKKR
jgi:hypothetical protein